MSNGSQRITDLESASVLNDADEFLFFQNSSNQAKKITKANMASTGGGLRGIFVDSRNGNDVGAVAATASVNAQLAITSAQGAQTSANGKSEVYYQNTQPPVAFFTGSISGTTLTVTSATQGSVIIGKPITNLSIADGTVITAFIAGTGTSGGVGQYTVSVSQTVSSGTIYCGYNPGDLWYDTDDNYKLYVYQNTGNWAASFAPMLRLDAGNRVTGLQKVGGTEADFVLIYDKFQIWNGTSAEVPFEIFQNVVYIKEAKIRLLDVGKLTAGYISGKAIQLSDSSAYIQSSTFIETWTAGRTFTVYTRPKANVGDQDLCKVLQSDGTYKIYKCLVAHTNQQPPNATYWQELTGATSPTLDSVAPNITVNLSTTLTTQIRDLGFRIVGSGVAEFASSIFRGVVVATEGFFGSSENAARIDSSGLLIGSNGRIASSGLTWNEGSTNPTGGTGFFLGRRNGQDQFFIGNQTGDYLRWSGTALTINGKLVGGSTVGTATDAGHGLTLYSPYGIRKGRPATNDDTGVLTFTGGEGNGVFYGAQLDLVGSVYTPDDLAGDDGSGQFIIQAGYRSTGSYVGPADGAISFRTSREYNPAANGNDNHSGIQRMRIELDGTVRVVYLPSNQVPSPQTKGYGLYLAPNLNPGRFLVEGSAGDKHIQIKNGAIKFSSTNTDTYDVSIYRKSAAALETDSDIYVGTSGVPRWIYFGDNSGRIVWGGSSGDTNLYRNGANLLKTDDNFEALSLTSTSTKRAKKNIKKYKGGLKIVESLKPVSYKRKSTNEDDIGFIAEEVNKVLPIIIRKDDENIPQSMDYSKLTVILVNAVKELSLEVERLKNKIK